MNPLKIFIVEDDDVILKALEKFLKNWSYDVYFPDDFSGIYEKFLEVKPDLVLLDVSLPFFNGYYWCEQIRKSSNVPIIFISSADENLNKIMAMNMGADDYISKPFDLDLLLAKIKALLRRSYEYKDFSNNISYKDLMIDRDRMVLKFDNK